MSISLFKIALAAIDRRSFAGAAHEIGRTEGAISKRIRQLEDELDIQLFDRRTKPPKPTKQAIDLAPAMRQSVRQYEDVINLAGKLKGSIEGAISLGVIPTVSEWLLAPALNELRESYPKLSLRIESGLSDALIEGVEASRLDAAIVTGSAGLSRRLTGELLVRETIVLVAPVRLSSRKPADLLQTEPIVRFNRAAGVGRIIDRILQTRAPGHSSLIELDSIQSIVQMVRYGLGVALIPEPPTRGSRTELRNDPDVVMMALDDKQATRDIVLVRKSERDSDPLVDAVRDAFRKQID